MENHVVKSGDKPFLLKFESSKIKTMHTLPTQ